jgi:anti-sigma regulatory factor (Ser/Thr protein kinase)
METPVSDRIRLTVPRDRRYVAVAHLVLGGVAMRQNLTLEALEDLQLAIDEVLGRERGDGSVTLELRLEDGSLEARLGPFDAGALEADLQAGDGTGLGLMRVLESTVDDVQVERGEDGDWVRLTKAASG